MTLSADDLRRLARPPAESPRDCACAALVCAGWESLPGPVGEPLLRHAGSLRPDGDEEPTLEEHHPDGTRFWSADAPVATAFFPYNRCELWLCRACGRGFLQYTEFGGYYVDHRVRQVDPARVC